MARSRQGWLALWQGGCNAAAGSQQQAVRSRVAPTQARTAAAVAVCANDATFARRKPRRSYRLLPGACWLPWQESLVKIVPLIHKPDARHFG